MVRGLAKQWMAACVWLLGQVACTPGSPGPTQGEAGTEPVALDMPVSTIPWAQSRPVRAPAPKPVAEPGSDPESGRVERGLPGGQPVVPAIMVHTVGDRDADWTDECEISVEVLEGFPAYDPVANEVVTVEFYDRKMSSFDDEIAVQWFDAGTGEVLRSELIMGDHGHMSCSGAGQRARRRSKAVNEQLASGRWESMETVPLRLVHGMSYQNLRYFSAEPNLTPEDLEVLAGLEESLMPRGEVHAVVRGGEMIVRLPGVRVYERDPALVELETVSRIVAHPSGVVVMTATTCRDEEDCTCNTEETSMVLRWSPTTLAAVQRWPCIADASEDGAEDGATCELQSIYL